MDSIVIVCGAGASSTFLASRMRSIAFERGLDVRITAVSTAELRPHLHTASALLVGPHLAAGYPKLVAEAGEFGVPTALLPETAFGPAGAQQAVELVGTLVTLGPAPAA